MLKPLAVFRDLVEADADYYRGRSAESRYELLKEIDPYPEITPSLLHAGHVASYVMAAGIIDPFEPAKYLTKPATYLVPLEGPCRYRDTDGVAKRFYLSNDISMKDKQHDYVRNQIDLKPNSIFYLTLKPTFRIPNYIACRFNLKIREVYRGLLVGTGPLVDPGFVGQLSIPIHNFTNQTYTLRADEGFVYFEFTKLFWKNPSAKNLSWVRPQIDFQPPFPESKREKQTLDDYLAAATGGGPPTNELMIQIEEAKKRTKNLESLLSQYRSLGIVAGVVLIVTVLGVVATSVGVALTTWMFVQEANKELRDSRDRAPAAAAATRSSSSLVGRSQ